jgi:hypothetical protein
MNPESIAWPPAAEREGRLQGVAASLTMSESDQLPAAEARTRLRPVVRAGLYFDLELQGAKLTAGQQRTLSEALGDATGIGIGVDSADSIMLATDKQLASWKLAFVEAKTIAIANLRAMDIGFDKVAPGVWASTAHDNYDSSRLLLVDEITALGLSPPVVAMIPNRDSLFLASGKDAAALLAMADLAEPAARPRQARQPLSAAESRRRTEHHRPRLPFERAAESQACGGGANLDDLERDGIRDPAVLQAELSAPVLGHATVVTAADDDDGVGTLDLHRDDPRVELAALAAPSTRCVGTWRRRIARRVAVGVVARTARRVIQSPCIERIRRCSECCVHRRIGRGIRRRHGDLDGCLVLLGFRSWMRATAAAADDEDERRGEVNASPPHC